MPDRLQEIRARLDAFDTEKPWVTVADAPLTGEMTSNVEWQDLIAHAPADIAWLLDEVERVTDERDVAQKWWHRWRRAAWEQRARRKAAE